MLQLHVRVTSRLAAMWHDVRASAGRVWIGARLRAIAPCTLARDEGQTTAEYALVILAAAAVGLVLLAWAKSSGKLPAFFDNIIDQITGSIP